MNFFLVVGIVAIASVLCTIWWTVRDETSWQTTVWGIAAVSFIVLSLAVTQNPEASEWALIFYLGSGVLVLAMASVATLRFRRNRAALLFLLAYVVASVQLGLMLIAVHGRESWIWLLWPTAAGAVMLFAARDRDGLPAVPLLRRSD